MLARRLVKGLFYLLGIPILLVVFGAGMLLLAMGFEHRVPLELPKPGGSFGIARTSFHWVNSDRQDEFAPSPGSKQELVVWVWYPAGTPGKAAEYLPLAWRDALASNSGFLMTDFMTRDLSKVRVHSTEGAERSAAQGRFPVVVLRAGAAALVTSYTVLAEDLASRGYIVVAPDAPYRTTVVVLPDGQVVSRPAQYNLELMPESERVPFATRLMRTWSADIGFIVDQLAKLNAADPSGRFTGRLDLQHLGVLGHSLGGATAAHFCHEDPRCKAGIDLDGQLFGPVIEDGLQQPFMFVLEDQNKVSDPTSGEIIAHIQSMYAHLPVDSRLRIAIIGSNHFSFSDQILLKSQWFLGIMRRTGAFGRLDGRRGLKITADYVGGFFDVYLKGGPRADLDALEAKYPEVRVQGD